MKRLAEFVHKVPEDVHLRFRKYLDSPYFFSDKRLLYLYDLLAEDKPENWDKPRLFAALFPGELYNADRINNFFSYLTRAAENFIGQEAWEKHPFYASFFKLQGARQMGLNRSFEHILKRENHQTSIAEDFYCEYLLADESDLFFLQKASREDNKSLDQKLASLHKFYLAAMLRTSCEWLSRNNVIGGSEQPPELSSSLPFLLEQAPLYFHIPGISIYYYILLTLTEPDTISHYHNLRESLGRESIHPEALKPMYQFAQNYCIFQVNRGNTVFLQSLFDLYDEMMKRNLLLNDGQISPGDVKNIVALGARLEKYEWADEFLLNIAQHIIPSYREAVLSYNQAYLLYSRKKLREAQRLLAFIEYPDLFYALGARTLLLKIYYELEDHEGFESLSQAFEAYLRRQRLLSTYQREAYHNLLRYAKKLSRLRTDAAIQTPSIFKRRLNTYLEKLQKAASVMGLDWLIQQATILKES
ncbi:MAG: hypothetical protein R3D00_18830 [Bacteroidia bacterium]